MLLAKGFVWSWSRIQCRNVHNVGDLVSGQSQIRFMDGFAILVGGPDGREQSG